MNRQLKLFSSNAPHAQALSEMIAICEKCNPSTDISLAFVSTQNTKKSRKVEMAHEVVQIDIKAAEKFQDVVSTTLNLIRDRVVDGDVIFDYDGTSQIPDDEIEYLDLSLESRVLNQIQPLDAPVALRTFHNRKSFMDWLRFYAIRIQAPQGAPVYGFHLYSKAYELRQPGKRFVMVARPSDPPYTIVDQPGFVFDGEIDCFSRGSDMFILHKERFLRLFRFYEYVEQDATNAIHDLNRRIPIQNLEELIAEVQRDQRMASKLSDLRRQPVFKRLTMARIRREINATDSPVRVVPINGQDHLVFAREHKSAFMILLRDSHVKSPMTDIDYLSDVKRPLHTRQMRQRGVIRAVPEPADVKDEV